MCLSTLIQSSCGRCKCGVCIYVYMCMFVRIFGIVVTIIRDDNVLVQQPKSNTFQNTFQQQTIQKHQKLKTNPEVDCPKSRLGLCKNHGDPQS